MYYIIKFLLSSQVTLSATCTNKSNLIAGEGAAFDYTVNTAQVRLLFETPNERAPVVFTFRVDTIAQEANETLQLRLEPVTPLPLLSEFIFRDTIDMVIIDSDSKIQY